MGSRRIKTYGGKSQVLPIKDKKMLKRVIDYLIFKKNHQKSEIKIYQAYRNYIMFLVGFNTAFRGEDLLQLRVKDVIKGYISIKENKTGKMQNFKMNKEFHEELLEYINTYKLEEKDYLFMGQKKKDTYKGVTKQIIYPITRHNALLICKEVAKGCGIPFNFGLHSLRKTFGYIYILNGGNIFTLMKMYNHDQPGTTLLYVMWSTDDAEKDREAFFIGKGRK